MEIYLVGGAVRDEILGMPIKERDWVVVGSTMQAMLDLGYKQVGKDFPVFLHPQTKEEYALARTERKLGHGYDGFVVHAAADVTLKDDLKRRDLSINAIAKDKSGELIDFFGGLDDLENRVLRHVSDAFVEDPLRLVRLCRFQARFPDFYIHSSTEAFCREIVKTGEINYLTPERVWLEWQKVFSAPIPEKFIETLDQLGAWDILMPGFNQVALDIQRMQLARQIFHDEYLFCVLGWYLDFDEHKKQLQGLRLPKDLLQMCLLVHSLYNEMPEITEHMQPESMLQKFQRWDVFRRKSRFEQACRVLQSVIGKQKLLEQMIVAASELGSMKPDLNTNQTMHGDEIAKNLLSKRVGKLSELMPNWHFSDPDLPKST